jgi:8-oxo-dGTP diphosphatase
MDREWLAEDRHPTERYVTCDRGHDHWGGGGAAGLRLHHQDENGTHRYLMQQRGPGVQHAGTWAPPSGALAEGEHPVQGALREAQEEIGPFQSSGHEIAHTNDHGGWAFHTVTADTPHMFDPQFSEESQDAAWLTPEEIDEMPLHPGFKESWNDLRPQPKQRFSAAIPNERELAPFRDNEMCYEYAAGVAKKWPHLRQESGFYVSDRPHDHSWNIGPDGTIVDTTAQQHPGPEIVPSDHPDYGRYVSYDRHPEQAQIAAHQAGLHQGTEADYQGICPLCTGKISSAAPQPPNLRVSTGTEHCGNCKMFDAGKCWGYGNVKVGNDDVCDSWSLETKESATKAVIPLPENEGKSTEPQEVAGPWDHWPEDGELTNEEKHHELQWADSGHGLVE